jgi:MFS family permease
MIMISFAPLIGVLRDELGISAGTASLGFMSLHAIATAIGCYISGILFARLGIFKVLAAAMVILIVSNASLPLFGHGFWPLVIIRIIEGFGCSACIVATGPLCADWFPKREVGIANGTQSVGVSLGMMLGLKLAPALAHSASSWQAGLAWLSVGNCVSFVLIVLVGIAAKKHMAESAQVQAEVASEVVSAGSGLSAYVFTLPFIVGILCFACGTWTQAAFNDLTPGYFAIAPPVGVGLGGSIGAVVAGNLFATVLAAGIIGSILSGILMDRVFGGRAKPLMLMGFGMIAICVVLLILPQVYGQRPPLQLCLFLTGMGTPFVNPMVLAFGAKSFPPAMVPRVIGVWGTVSTVSQGVGVTVGAMALKSTGNYHLSLWIVSMVATLGFVVALFTPKAKHAAAHVEAEVSATTA